MITAKEGWYFTVLIKHLVKHLVFAYAIACYTTFVESCHKLTDLSHYDILINCSKVKEKGNFFNVKSYRNYNNYPQLDVKLNLTYSNNLSAMFVNACHLVSLHFP